MSTPFSYHLYHTPTKKHYYGIRHGKKADPNTLWKTYFTSSVIVKQLIEQYGLDSFEVEIRRTFENSQEAILWEHRVLRRLNAASKENWINRHNGGKKFRGPKIQSEKTKKKISKKITGLKRKPETIAKQKIIASAREQRKKEIGYKMPDSGKQNISKGLRNPEVQAKIYTADRNKKMAQSKTGTKRKYLADGSFIMARPQEDQ